MLSESYKKRLKDLAGLNEVAVGPGGALQDFSFGDETQPNHSDEFFPITIPVSNKTDLDVFKQVAAQGIDSHLEAFTKSQFGYKVQDGMKRIVMNFHKSELPILLRRLHGIGTVEADMWADDIEIAVNKPSEEL